ncbi:MAG: ATP-binding cassette domain-containing protein [Acidobacteria bacterium]|nr:ATP-binding cassette domain-containing protein [Acidobacteriota bacterium]MBV9477381.1 ATP-binding cassette domain-containing protein [Acidobacteriota bacterium]
MGEIPLNASPQAPFVVLDRLTVEYRRHGDNHATAAVQDLSLSVQEKEFVAVVGPSGCGKSTLIHTLAGFVPPTRGTVTVGGAVIQGPSPDRGVLFQRLGLFPWATVAANVRFGLDFGGTVGDGRASVAELLQRVGLESFADFYPAQLSGGMAQRVAIARVLAPAPQVLLLDEPFVALDAQTRDEMHQLLLRLHERKPMTVILVTHDVEEAVLLADRVIVLSARPAHVVQDVPVDLGRPRERDMAMDERFIASRIEISDALREEVLRARLQARTRTLRAKGRRVIRVGAVPTAESAPLTQIRATAPTDDVLYEFFEYDSGAAIVRTLLSGECDVAVLGACPVLAALHEEAALVVVRDGGHVKSGLAAALVATPTVAGLTPEELAELPIGINGRGSNAEYLTRAFFRDIQREVSMVVKPFDQLLRELEKRRLQLAGLPAPYLQRAVTDLGCAVVCNFAELVNPLQIAVVVCRRELDGFLLHPFVRQWDIAVREMAAKLNYDGDASATRWSNEQLADRLAVLDHLVVAPAYGNTLRVSDYVRLE